jgi:DNA-binding XRE family transcriptional regulator
VTHSPLTHSLQYRILHSMDVRKKIGLRIKELRKNIGISQFEFALRCELDRTYINGIENGRRNVSILNEAHWIFLRLKTKY